MQQLKYNVLLIACRLNVEPHDSLVQQLVSEASLRIDRYCMIVPHFFSFIFLMFKALANIRKNS